MSKYFWQIGPILHIDNLIRMAPVLNFTSILRVAFYFFSTKVFFAPFLNLGTVCDGEKDWYYNVGEIDYIETPSIYFISSKHSN